VYLGESEDEKGRREGMERREEERGGEMRRPCEKFQVASLRLCLLCVTYICVLSVCLKVMNWDATKNSSSALKIASRVDAVEIK